MKKLLLAFVAAAAINCRADINLLTLSPTISLENQGPQMSTEKLNSTEVPNGSSLWDERAFNNNQDARIMVIRFTWAEAVTVSKIRIYWAHGNTHGPASLSVYTGSTTNGTFVASEPGSTQVNNSASDYADYTLEHSVTVTQLTCAIETDNKWVIIQRFWPMAAGSACVHEWSDWTIVTAATCTDPGERTRHCSKCNDDETQEIPALGGEHQWDEGVVTRPATESTSGIRTYTCSRCGATKTEAIPATGNSEYLCPYATSVTGAKDLNVLLNASMPHETDAWGVGNSGRGASNSGYGTDEEKRVTLGMTWPESVTVARIVIVCCNDKKSGHAPSEAQFYADGSSTPLALNGDPIVDDSDPWNCVITYQLDQPVILTNLTASFYYDGWMIIRRYWVYGSLGGEPPPPEATVYPGGVIVF